MPSFIEREQSREFTPANTNTDAIAQSFQTKLSYWKEGASQVKSAYQNYLGLDLTNSTNQDGLAEYMKTAKQEIQKATSLDFSIGENQSQILGVFDNLTNGKTQFSRNVLADHSVTKSWNDALAKGESSRYTNNGKDFNQASLNAIQNQKELFRQGNGSEGTAKIAASMMEKYTPYYDVLAEKKRLIDSFETDVSDKTTPIGQGYLIHQKDSSWKDQKLKDYIDANATDKYKEQIGIEARADFYNHKLIAKQNPELVVNAYADNYNRANQSEIQEYTNKVNESNKQLLTLDPKDPEYQVTKNALTSNIKSLQDNITTVNQRKFDPNIVLSDDYREGANFAQSLKWNQETNNFAKSFAHQDTVQEYKMDQGYFANQNLQLARSKFSFSMTKDARDFKYQTIKDAKDFGLKQQAEYADELENMRKLGITPSESFMNIAVAAGVDPNFGNPIAGSNGQTSFTSAGTSNQNTEGGTFNKETGQYIYGNKPSVSMIDYQRQQLSDMDKNIQNSYKDGVIGAFAAAGNFGNQDAAKVEAQLKMYSNPQSSDYNRSVKETNYSPEALKVFGTILNASPNAINAMSNGMLSKSIDKIFTSADGHETLKTMIQNGKIPGLEIGSFVSNINRQQAVRDTYVNEVKDNILKTLNNLGLTNKDIDNDLLINPTVLRQAYKKDTAWFNSHKGFTVKDANNADEEIYQQWLKEKVTNPLRSINYTNNLDPKTYQTQNVSLPITLDNKGQLTPIGKSNSSAVNESLYDYAGSGGNAGKLNNIIVHQLLQNNPKLVSQWIVKGNTLKPIINREEFAKEVKIRNPNDKKADSFTITDGTNDIKINEAELNTIENTLVVPIKAGSQLSQDIDPMKTIILKSTRSIVIPIEKDYDNQYNITVGNSSNSSISNNQPQEVGFNYKIPKLSIVRNNGTFDIQRDSQGNVIMETNSSEDLKRTNPGLYQQYQQSFNIRPTEAIDRLQTGALYQGILRDYLNSEEGKKIQSIDQLPDKYKKYINSN